jgi:hypothetical protein
MRERLRRNVACFEVSLSLCLIKLSVYRYLSFLACFTQDFQIFARLEL